MPPALFKKAEDWIATLDPKTFDYDSDAAFKNEAQSQQETKSKNQSQTQLSVKQVAMWIVVTAGAMFFFRP